MFDLNVSNESLATTYKESIEKILQSDANGAQSLKNTTASVELTYESALERLLKANKHLDELSAKIMLERSLKFEDGKLEFSRDIGVPKFMPIRYHFSEFLSMRESIVKNINSPILHVYAHPYAYGEITFNFVSDLIESIRVNSKNRTELVKMDNVTHHFHMIHPHAVSKFILGFLEKIPSFESKL